MTRLFRRLLIVACTAAFVSAASCTQTSADIVISQAPNQFDAYFSDPSIPQSLADNFVIGAGGDSLGTLTWYGIYAFANFLRLRMMISPSIFSASTLGGGLSISLPRSGVDIGEPRWPYG